jgi:endogenous inhibitor of DNA gyrase (YacG/DUF329 family)
MIEAVRRNDPVRCPVCERSVERQSGRGRQPKFCSDACRQRAFRRGVSRNEVTADSPQIVNFVTKVCSKNNGLEASKNDLEKAKLFWIEVNNVTWKLTDGEISRTPASFGQWGGYNTERALAWVIDTGWPARKPLWYARRNDRSWGPTTSLARAKKAALGFVTGVAPPQDEHARAFIGEIDLCAVILPPEGEAS